MKLIIPMAGMGKRLRPHTLTIPKPLLPIAGEPIVKHLTDEITKVSASKIEEIAFIIGDFGKETEKRLLKIASDLGIKGKLYHQKEALGTAHAVFCAQESLQGKIIIAFADTLFKADFHLNEEEDAVIWINKVKNPESFGVVKKNEKGYVTDFIEKPQKFVSDEAIIGIYYFKSGENLYAELKYLIDNNIKGNNEFQLTDALENMKKNGIHFKTTEVIEWLDCGNKNATVQTNQRILHYLGNKIKEKALIINSVIIEPCFIDKNVKISNSVIGPYVSIGNNNIIKNCIIENSIIQESNNISFINIRNSMVGNDVNLTGKALDMSIGDFSNFTFSENEK